MRRIVGIFAVVFFTENRGLDGVFIALLFKPGTVKSAIFP